MKFALYLIAVKTRGQTELVAQTLRGLERHDPEIVVCPIEPADLCKLADEWRADEMSFHTWIGTRTQ